MEKNAGKYLSISFAVLTCIALILSLKISLVYIRAESYYGNETYFENGFHFLKRDIITLANELFYDVGASSIKIICLLCVVFGAIGIAVFRQERQAALYIRRLGCDVLFVFLFAFGNSIYSGNRGEDFGGSIEQYDIS